VRTTCIYFLSFAKYIDYRNHGYCFFFQLCIPRYSTVEKGSFTEKDVKDHIIISTQTDKESYSTWSGEVTNIFTFFYQRILGKRA